MTQKQRDFLKAAAEEATPITFVDASGTFSVYLSRLRFETPRGGKLADRLEEEAVLTFAEATGGVWNEAQVEFLRQAANDIVPVKLDWTDGRSKLVLLTRIAWQTPYKGPRGIEPVLQLTLVDSFGPRQWLSFPPDGARIAETLTAISLYGGTIARYGTATYGYSGYG